MRKRFCENWVSISPLVTNKTSLRFCKKLGFEVLGEGRNRFMIELHGKFPLEEEWN